MTNNKPKLYILNSPIIPIKNDKECEVYVLKTKNLAKARMFVSNSIYGAEYELVSAIGHESTAKILSYLLEMEIKPNRIAITVDEKDRILAFTLDFRLPEGKVLTEDELEKILNEGKYSFTIMYVESCTEA